MTKGGSGSSSSNNNNKRRVKVTFDDFYKQAYGDRWPQLRAAMCEPSVKVAMYNRFCKIPVVEVMEGLDVVPSPTLRLFQAPRETPSGLLDQPPRDEKNTAAYYMLDYASTVIVEQLQVDAFHKVLDLCGAPGGKSIAIAQFLSPQGELTSNECNRERGMRLKRNLHDFIPPNSCIWQVTMRDGTTWHSPESFDRVLVDAPCSSERHLLQQSGGTQDWNVDVTATLAKIQGTLLLRALEAVKVGGRVVYSTCSISNQENDSVVAFALARTRCHVVVEKTELPLGEATTYGCIMLPDTSSGWGPMYCATFTKAASQRPLSDEDDADSSDDEDESN